MKIKIPLKGIFICAPGWIRTTVALRRQIYSLLYLTALPPTQVKRFYLFECKKSNKKHSEMEHYYGH